MNADMEINMDEFVDEYLRYMNGITSNVTYPMVEPKGKKCSKYYYEWNQNGTLNLCEKTIRNKSFELIYEYYDNGQLKYITFYKNDKGYGLAQHWDVDGNIVAKGRYKNGQLILS